jgi:hypothetical protein
LLLFRRGRALKTLEEGLRWKAAGASGMPGRSRLRPEGVFVTVPNLNGNDQLSQYIEALAAESAHVLGYAKPGWVQLRGSGICALPMDRVKAIVQAACPSARSIGLEINPEVLEPGALAGYRSIDVERLGFTVDTPYAQIDDPIRKARALGGYASVEICLGGKLTGKTFLQIVERALTAAPNQLSVSDARSHGAFGAELLEKAGEMCTAAGMQRTSAWVWSHSGRSFDSLGILLSGRSANLGPDAVTCRPQAFANPEFKRWLSTRLSGDFEVIHAEGRLEQWLALAAGLYALELRRDSLDCKMHRHVASLERMGVLDKKGRPTNAQAMEFCHRAARAARHTALGTMDLEWLIENAQGEETAAIRARG